MKNVTREAVETLAKEQSKSVMAMLTELQQAAAVLNDEGTLDALCNIKAEILGL